MIQGTPISRSTERLNRIQSTIITALRIFNTNKIVYLTISISLSRYKESQPNNSFNYDLPLIRLLRATEVFVDRNLKKVLLDCIAMRCYLSPQCNLIRPLVGADSLHCVALVRFNTMRRALFVVHKKKPHETIRTAFYFKKSTVLNGG